jgi:hypothetical protein
LADSFARAPRETTGPIPSRQSPCVPGPTLALLVVVSVNVDRTGDEPGVTVSGLNEQAVPGGSDAPLHDNATGLL